jgi:aarF domain-containing kinase
MEKLNGVSLLDAASIAKITDDPEATIITALNVWTTSVMTMPWFHADVHAGNLLVLGDGRVGFIDFGIVGRVSPQTFNAVTELSTALAVGDYEAMAQALCNMGATDQTVDVKKFGVDLKRVMENLSVMQPDIMMTQTVSGEVQGTVGFDETELTQVMVDLVNVAEDNGLKLPREFGLLVKQSLYFDRYLKILAPRLDVMGDDRVRLGGAAAEGVKTDPVDVVIDVQ